jgi:hypothetical protein
MKGVVMGWKNFSETMDRQEDCPNCHTRMYPIAEGVCNNYGESEDILVRCSHPKCGRIIRTRAWTTYEWDGAVEKRQRLFIYAIVAALFVFLLAFPWLKEHYYILKSFW